MVIIEVMALTLTDIIVLEPTLIPTTITATLPLLIAMVTATINLITPQVIAIPQTGIRLHIQTTTGTTKIITVTTLVEEAAILGIKFLL
jgi:hypothetical protein